MNHSFSQQIQADVLGWEPVLPGKAFSPHQASQRIQDVISWFPAVTGHEVEDTKRSF